MLRGKEKYIERKVLHPEESFGNYREVVPKSDPVKVERVEDPILC